ncbi:SDR family NAD(P)-dependent oxidoreductase [Paracoccus sp. 1_MG-2023]|uniref:SDR family NAD(P)-dependent oxidoreductase n=1 Tax=unclassified Paracoccus (in: a-proteobacteria) TaxID=2688777 RepID=UPI001C092AED|nr:MULTISPECIES: SDR family NAD(P)-dependent oxidoreductase [unclassified Paracoccus (in: a-proteobacteria)]MBU2956053.1 SDR family NAD(P)-dependent oxidoreductase [Paracoccus sp. C2R09]MDO6669459.1 SDR family NAD(P)-dependent oxidoreductase [Paracoccus sp. 1_MG-2023]
MTIMITGATDGLGRATAQALAEAGHDLVVHGRSGDKLVRTAEELRRTGVSVQTALADMSDLGQVAAMARGIDPVDVLINNAGVFRIPDPITPDGLDRRFVVNSFAPALLTRLLAPRMPGGGRVIHLSSAAQAPVDIDAMNGRHPLQPMEAYAQSKLALTIWSSCFAAAHLDGPLSIAVNPGSLLATTMVREGFGTSGNDINIGVDILVRAALSEEFAEASGRYYDNDARRFANPHPEAANAARSRAVIDAIEARIAPFMTPAH